MAAICGVVTGCQPCRPQHTPFVAADGGSGIRDRLSARRQRPRPAAAASGGSSGSGPGGAPEEQQQRPRPQRRREFMLQSAPLALLAEVAYGQADGRTIVNSVLGGWAGGRGESQPSRRMPPFAPAPACLTHNPAATPAHRCLLNALPLCAQEATACPSCSRQLQATVCMTIRRNPLALSTPQPGCGGRTACERESTSQTSTWVLVLWMLLTDVGGCCSCDAAVGAACLLPQPVLLVLAVG